jgi:hypothetical protein
VTRPSRRLALLAALAAGLVATPAAAHAEGVGGAELRALAARAAVDPAALERLRGVDRIDGRPADLATALRNASGRELASRLAALAQPAAPPRGSSAAAARAEAGDILAGRRFSPPRVPGPFRGLLDRLGDRLAPVIGIVPALDDLLPGGRPVVWILIALAVGAAAAALAGRTLRRRLVAVPRTVSGPGPVPDDDAPTLERRAHAAAARGDHALALRLGFQAGLLRLDRRGVIELHPSLSTGDVVRAVHTPAFERVAARFDEVVYGGRAASADDVDTAESVWAAVLSDRRAA